MLVRCESRFYVCWLSWFNFINKYSLSFLFNFIISPIKHHITRRMKKENKTSRFFMFARVKFMQYLTGYQRERDSRALLIFIKTLECFTNIKLKCHLKLSVTQTSVNPSCCLCAISQLS